MNMRISKTRCGVTSLSQIILWTLLLTILHINVNAYNWVWDQGHDVCVFSPDHDEYGYVTAGGNWVPDVCCIIYCTMCNIWGLSGSFYETVTDLTVPGKGPQLSFKRTYNSIDPVNGLLGHGWTVNWGKAIIPITGKDGLEYIIVRRDNGQELKMLRTGTVYTFETDMQYHFSVEDYNEGWKMTEKSGMFKVYNSDGKITSLTDHDGLSITAAYDATTGCLNRLTNASGNYIDITRNPNGKISSIIDNFGNTVQYAYDADNNLVTVTYDDGSAINYTYDNKNLLLSLTNKRGQVITTLVYDENRRVIQYTERGETFTMTYDNENYQRTKTDSHGRTWTYQMDSNGVVIEEIDPLGNTVKREANLAAGQRGVNWEEDANGNRTLFTWDEGGNKTSITDPLGNTESYSYDANNNMISFTDAEGVITNYTYDVQGNMAGIVEAAGTAEERITVYEYTNGLKTRETKNGYVTTYDYDTFGNKILQVGPAGDSTKMQYDSIGNLILTTSPTGAKYSYEYDTKGNRTKE